MGADIPKQYLKIHGTPVLEHTLEKLATHPEIEGIVLAIGADDEWWEALEPTLSIFVRDSLTVIKGGAERFHSVLNGLLKVQDIFSDSGLENDVWALVHDAARPCVSHEDISSLIAATMDNDICGAILAAPVRDTMKRGDGQARIQASVDRNDLWHALTPQLFPLPLLLRCMEQAKPQVERVTDEASALELAGYHPMLVEGSASNLKITHPEDLALAEFYLAREEKKA